MSWMLARIVSAVAEGKMGATAKRAYWAAAGKKTWIAAVLALLWGVLELAQRPGGVCELGALPCTQWAAWIGTAAAALAAIGLYDGALRAQPPTKANSVSRFGASTTTTTFALVLCALLGASGCASAAARFGREPRPKAPNAATVEDLVCRGQVAEARQYVQDRGGLRPDETELVSAACRKAADNPECVQCAAVAGAGSVR